jgi:hypothetical protein
MDVGVRNDVDLAGTLELSVSGEFSDPRPGVGVLHGTVTGSLTLTGDFDGNGVDDTATATASGSIFCSEIYAQTQTNNEQCSLAIAFNGELLGETISGILEIQANVDDTLATTGDHNPDPRERQRQRYVCLEGHAGHSGQVRRNPAAGHTDAGDQLQVLPGGNDGNGEFGAQHDGRRTGSPVDVHIR